MNLVAWNVRGFNKAYKQKEFKLFLKNNSICVIAVLEHRVKEHNATKIISKFGRGWGWCHNYQYSSRGRIWILWDPNYICYNMVSMSEQYIHGSVSIHKLNLLFNLTVVYGSHTIDDRRRLWAELRSLYHTQQGPWAVMDDFNTIMSAEDRQGGSPVQEVETRDFCEYLLDTGMAEMKSIG
ncbi:uncharacterized protein LOC142165276 [Nicotiana tabacum]|uniref:Uncharacterized protein LOC142165276 n=1 Tax=Nicotiana tabacum TaxID=4097 RepID=A0AC58S4Q3_TOBAC